MIAAAALLSRDSQLKLGDRKAGRYPLANFHGILSPSPWCPPWPEDRLVIVPHSSSDQRNNAALLFRIPSNTQCGVGRPCYE